MPTLLLFDLNINPRKKNFGSKCVGTWIYGSEKVWEKIREWRERTEVRNRVVSFLPLFSYLKTKKEKKLIKNCNWLHGLVAVEPCCNTRLLRLRLGWVNIESLLVCQALWSTYLGKSYLWHKPNFLVNNTTLLKKIIASNVVKSHTKKVSRFKGSKSLACMIHI